MNNTNKEKKDPQNCELPETRSISEKVHKHLRDKNDHITDEDIRNADINPDANELEDLHRKEASKKEQDTIAENKQPGKEQITPWDVVDPGATQ